MRRNQTRSTIMTSNRPLEEWGKLLSDIATVGAILNRFLHHAQTIAINGRSYRLKQNPSPTNLRPQNRRAEWLAFRFCSFYFDAECMPLDSPEAYDRLGEHLCAVDLIVEEFCRGSGFVRRTTGISRYPTRRL